MSKREDDYPPTRGLRIKAIREAIGCDQEAFARLLTEEAKRRQIGDFDEEAQTYDRTTVSKMEKGRRDVSLTDAVLAAALDPKGRTAEWIGGAAELKSPRSRRKASSE